MKLMGSIDIDGLTYFAVLQQAKTVNKWFLYSEIDPKNFALSGKSRYENSMKITDLLRSSCSEYLVESISMSKSTGKVKIYKSSRRLDKIINAFISSKDFSYPKDGIYEDTYKEDLNNTGYKKTIFRAYHETSRINYTKVDDMYIDIEFSYDGVVLDLKPNDLIRCPRSLEYEELEKGKNSSIEILTMDNVDADRLSNIVDLSWYRDKETKAKKKDYFYVNTIKDLESKVFTPLVREILNPHNGKRAYIACDTETTGFNLLCLKDTNPLKDFITTIQFSWKDNQGCIIYLDMLYHDNVPKEYVIQRFGQLFKYYLDDYKFDVELKYDEQGNEINEVVTLDRRKYDLIGHNSIFDSRVTLSEGLQYYFDHDTLQMAFNINPTNIKMSKGLKALTRYFFNEETAELTDILGKGNEGKFGYLKDTEVTEIYGCADVDYTRKIYFELKKLMSDKMFKSYKSLDPIIWYLSARSEYYGLRVDSEFIRHNAQVIKEDLRRIEQFAHSYVGTILQHMNGAEEVESIELGKNVFEFKLTGNDVRRVMYKLLEYPVVLRSQKTGEPAVNSKAFKHLLYHRNTSGVGLMKEDLYSCEVPKPGKKRTVLISAKEFNSYKYPLCYILKAYKTLEKEYTGYYKPFEKDDMEGRLFKRISTTNIETRRISCPAQTTKKKIKEAILPVFENFYGADWDVNQIEARAFTSMAGDIEGVKRLDDFEKDYHTENASLMNKVPAYLVTKKQRSDSKATGFGIPYGLLDFSLCERLFTEVNDYNMQKTRIVRGLFEKVNQKEMDFLNGVRDKALEVADASPELKRFWGLEPEDRVSMVKNPNGFYRYFDLENVLGDKKKEASVRRAAGNYPIQSYSADIYRFMIKRLWENIVRAGLEDKIIFNMYIHDEVLFSVSKTVDPVTVAKLCADSCMIKLKGHTSYYIGLNFGNSWYQCKDDAGEMPSGLLLRIAGNPKKYSTFDGWVDDPYSYSVPIITKYKHDRVIEQLEEYCPSMHTDGIDVRILLDGFENYTVRNYLYEVKPAYKPEDGNDDDFFTSCLCSILVETNNSDLDLVIDNSTISVEDYIAKRNAVTDLVSSMVFEEEEIIDDDDDDDDDDEDSNKLDLSEDFWSFDSSDDEFTSFIEYSKTSDEEDIDAVISKMLEPEKLEYSHIQQLGNTIVLKLETSRKLDKLKSEINKYKSSGGKKVLVETPLSTKIMGKYNLNLDEIDKFINSL